MQPLTSLLKALCVVLGTTTAAGADSSSPPASAPERPPEHTAILHCAFDERSDRNFDKWPDEWTRPSGPRFPHYVRIAISREPSPAGDCCLRIDLDGGAGAAFSPPVPVSPEFSYILEGWIKTDGLEHDRAWISLTLLDPAFRRLESFQSVKLRDTDGWQRVRLGPVAASNPDAEQAVVGVHLEPESSSDLRGSARFDELRLWRLPRMRLESSQPDGIFTPGTGVEILCTISGFTRPQTPLRFVLEGPAGEELARHQEVLQGRMARTGPALLDEVVAEEPFRAGTVRWRPPLSGPGFYRVRAILGNPHEPTETGQITLAVLSSETGGGAGVFGWSLPRGEHPLPIERLERVLVQAGVGWVKYPLWFDEQPDAAALHRLLRFCEALGTRGIGLVGLLDEPPRSLSSELAPGRHGAADVFALDPKIWYPSIETALAQTATQVRWWQLGSDEDTSFVSDPHRDEKLALVKQHLDRIGQDVNLGLGWDWRSPLPEQPAQALWRFLSLSADPRLSAPELADHLEATQGARAARFVVLRPLGREHALEQRVTDLLERMMAARIHAADAVFCPDPFDADCGLMNPDGTPGELLLPWRTAALLLGRADHLGSLQLPGGSANEVFVQNDQAGPVLIQDEVAYYGANEVFVQNDQAVMVVWNPQPTRETIALGPDARLEDPWGRPVAVSTEEGRHVFQVGPLPTFVSRLSLAVTLWRMSCKLHEQQFPSIFGRPHGNVLRFANRFPQAASGTARFVAPRGWQVQPAEFRFRVAPGESFEQPFEIILPYHADTGAQPLRVDFDLQAGSAFKFSVFRRVEVGLGDVRLEASTRLNDSGELEVEQKLTNAQAEPVSFRCQLYVPDRRKLGCQVIDLGQGQHVHLYHLPDGEQLLGKTLWLRAIEVDGPRTLSHRFVAAARSDTFSSSEQSRASAPTGRDMKAQSAAQRSPGNTDGI